MSTNETDTQETVERCGGRVKWFNNKAGFGFITVCDGDREGEDVFVHHTAINVTGDWFKYLVQGEYVEFTWSENTDDSDHKWQANDVQGVNGWKLMCETRAESRAERNVDDSRPQRQQQTRPSYRGGGPRSRGPREQWADRPSGWQQQQHQQHQHQHQHQHAPRYGGARNDSEELRNLLWRIKQLDLPQSS